MIPLSIPNLSEDAKENLEECIETNYVSTIGPFVKKFEEKLAEIVNTTGAVATMNGTSGLHLALEVTGVESDDLVILPTVTFIASANAISYCGADPWLIDVRSSNWTINVDLLRKKLSEETKRKNGELVHVPTDRTIRAILAVHPVGLPPNLSALRNIADQYDLPLISDVAASIGASYEGQPVGSVSDAAVFSFNGNKTITCGGGGAVVSSDESLLEDVEHLATTARPGDEYHHDQVGYNYKMTNLQAAVGCSQLERVPEFVKNKRKIHGRYRSACETLDPLEGFPEVPWGEGSRWLSGVVVRENSGIAPDELRSHLRDGDCDAGSFWKPIHLQPPYETAPSALTGSADSLWNRVVPLPCSTSLADSEQNEVLGLVREFLS